MDITAIIMGICPPHRLAWLRQSVDYLDAQNFPFARKIISVDQFDGHLMPYELTRYFESKGWIVLIDSHRSRVKSMDRAFSLVETEYIFYNEDDVLVEMPHPLDLTYIFGIKWEDRKCGMISLTLGGTKFDPPFIGDLSHMESFTILLNEKYRAFLRFESYANAWFFEFPGLFIRSDLFKQCHELAKNIHGQIEQALTQSYFSTNLSKEFYKCSIAKPDALQILNKNCLLVNSHCRLLTNLDPNQGNSPYASSQGY